MFMGGAVSVDQPRRVAGIDWFQEEAPTAAQIERALANGSVDVVVAHEGLPDTPLVSTYSGHIPPEIAAHAHRVRELMGGIADALRPQIWAHGHWHHRMTARRNDTVVQCLHESRGPFRDTSLICDLETLETRPLTGG
jgi:hypothetical protein